LSTWQQAGRIVIKEFEPLGFFVGQELLWRQDREHERQPKRRVRHQGRDDERFEDAPAAFPTLDEELDEYRPARAEHGICGAKVIVFCVLRDKQDENAYADDAYFFSTIQMFL
jgi:hypothetical protein